MLLLSSLSRHVLLGVIRVYQTCISPYKGFRCAYGWHTGRASCSQLGLRVVRRHGVAGLPLLRRRMTLCGVAHRRYGARAAVAHAPAPPPRSRYRPQSQRGDCDIGCDGFDAPCDGEPDLGDLSDCCSCFDCNFSSRKKKQKRQEDEENERLPPQRSHLAPSASQGDAP